MHRDLADGSWTLEPARGRSLTRGASHSLGAAPQVELLESEAGTPDLVERELEKILAEVRSWRDEDPVEEPAAEGEAPEWSEDHAAALLDEPVRPKGELAAGYLEDHLAEARLSVADMDDAIGKLTTTAEYLRHRVTLVGSDLDRITREYLVTREREERPVPHSEPPRAASAAPWATTSIPSAHRSGREPTTPPHRPQSDAGSGTPAVYEQFTLERYNQTVGAMASRRGALIGLTLLLSALIGSILVLVVVFSPTASPPFWVAVLPLVWVVPIPFFLLSLRGTHRVLDRTDLRLPRAE
jgi:hypothetical protein